MTHAGDEGDLASPCTGDCRLRPWRGAASPTCKGCERTLDEIVRWPNFDAATKRAVLARVAGLRGTDPD